jgi:NAD(P)-dependent dehydrogenase (short-subunit alcohol dehydrogenase family)
MKRIKRLGRSSWTRLFFQGGICYLGWQLFRVLRTQDIRGQVVMVTGGSRGLGLELARQFAREGCRIAICARDDQELERARIDLEALGAEVAVHRCDVSDRDRVEAMVAAVVERFGGVDIVVNNAGIFQVGPFESMTPGDFERAMAVNFWGPLNVIWAALPSMRQRGRGQIVNVTSIGAEISVPHLLPYDCAKAAFLRLSEGLAAELARQGIKVTTVVPGLMRTGSPVNASFKGNAQREFEWFSLGDSLVLTSTSAERAARRIVGSARRGEGKVVLTWQAKLLRVLHGLAPNAVVRALGWVNGRLPGERGLRFESRRGKELAESETATGRRLDDAARRFNQYDQSMP